jgi:hypothetical protein
MMAAQDSRAREELCLYLDCAPYLLAVETRWVERLLLAEEVLVTEPDGSEIAADRPLRGDAIVRAGGAAFAAWDLDALLEVKAGRRAWVLMQLPAAPRAAAVALRTGPCLFVRELKASVALPPGLFRSRTHAITHAFAAADVKAGAAAAPVGIQLDPTRLFSNDELDRAQSTLTKASAPRSP